MLSRHTRSRSVVEVPPLALIDKSKVHMSTKKLILIAAIIGLALPLTVPIVEAGAVKTTCTFNGVVPGVYNCGKALKDGWHIKIDHNGQLCHGDVSNIDPPPFAMADVEITEDIDNCFWGVGDTINIVWNVPKNPKLAKPCPKGNPC